MSYTNKITWNPLQSIDSSTFTGSYLLLGTLLNPATICKIVNNSNVLVTISVDGLQDHDILPANSFVLYDEDASGTPDPQVLPNGTKFFVKGSVGSGLVYLISQYIIQT